MISKDKFINIMNTLHEYHIKEYNLNDAMDAFSEDFCTMFFPLSKYEGIIIDLLNNEFNLKSNDICGTDIDYFVYELDYGEKYKPGCVTEVDGSFIDISTPDKLYDYLINLGGSDE